MARCWDDRRARRPRGVSIAYEPWASLTDGERSVANLMAEGLTNREIAGELRTLVDNPHTSSREPLARR